ncbi:MAG: hypothetical protein M1814_002268 [Vezdaea aestivalis]|nr:MAG: hypothetical protein M1814_002268 [Vezdaea aestivalis]
MAPPGDVDVSAPIKRIRWATQRVTGQSGKRKRHSILTRLHKRSESNEKANRLSGQSEDVDAASVDAPVESKRRIFFNIPLPDDARDEDGHPLAHYERNKIRTAKYTPLSFVPKNLWYQFHNIANVYFLFIIILTFFPIFGGSNPGLSCVPLIAILLVTAIKDAIEDYRRTILDNELNNAPLYRLVEWNNVNTTEDNIGWWRRVKKASTKTIKRVYRWGKARFSKKQKAADASVRRSIDTRATPRNSMYSTRTDRTSFQSARSVVPDVYQMTPVPSPPPPHLLHPDDAQRPDTSFSFEAGQDAPKFTPKFYGSLIDDTKQTPEKAKFKKDYWKGVQVGDFVRIYNNDQIPADVVILSTSDPDGACYVETKNLDGETNLKVREALRAGRKVKHARDCEKCEFTIDSEPPHANLYSYSAVARWKQRDSEDSLQDMAEPISIHNLLLRGCSLRNTDWVLGVVVFTGRETKIMLNAGATPSKRSRISRELNWNVMYNFGILFAMCFISGTIQGVTWAHGHNSLDYFEFGSVGGKPSLDGFITFWSAVILFQNLVPISLYISIEIIKTAQAFFIYSDTLMYYDVIDYPCTPKSWNISDDVGQIEYIFSDKTGTLTQNVMEFKKCTINGVPYGEAYTEAQAGMRKRQGVDIEEEGSKAHKQIAADREKMLKQMRDIHQNPYLYDEDLTFVAPDFVGDLAGDSGDLQKEANARFMLTLALCHTVITERSTGPNPKVEFKAQSPDEAALVSTARDVGFTALGRTNDGILVNSLGVEKEYTILNTLEFNSSRKRMSAIIRMPDSNKIILFCKGADSVIWARLRADEQAQLRKETADHLEMFAREGLRTLCIAERELSEEEYQVWSKKHDVAAAAVVDREDKLEEVADQIERELTLLGGTAIEDRLQDGVPDTISLLGDAGIKLWVLTGDKVETAINIGFACNLLSNEMELLILKIQDEQVETAEAELNRYLKIFDMTGSDEELVAAKKNHEPPEPTYAIVIDGDSLKLVLDPTLRQKFLLLCKQCKSVLCCRVSPSQKAAVVQMVKEGLDVMTLSVGDGANDVAMIQEADVGVGIAGEEGRQAVMSSDYAIGQFRFLQRLILVHGRWSYRRLAETIANFFYKNMIWTFALFWYQIYNNFDCVYLFDYTYILLVNLAFTSVPVVLMGILDQDVSDKVSLAVPQLYRRGIERKEWTQKKFWLYMFDGIYQSVICFFITYLLFAPASFVTSQGTDINDTSRMGVYVATATVTAINTYILMNTYRWDWIQVLVVVISILLVYFWTGVYTAFTSANQFYKAAPEVYGQLTFWCTVLLTVLICLLPRFVVKSYQKIYMPRDVDIVREQVRQGKFDYLEDADKDEKPSPAHSPTSSELKDSAMQDDERPIYPPSVAATATTHNQRSQNGSDGTEYTRHRDSLERPTRISLDRPRPSYERARASMDQLRPSFEASHDLTSAGRLMRLESSHSRSTSRHFNDITADLK